MGEPRFPAAVGILFIFTSLLYSERTFAGVRNKILAGVLPPSLYMSLSFSRVYHRRNEALEKSLYRGSGNTPSARAVWQKRGTPLKKGVVCFLVFHENKYIHAVDTCYSTGGSLDHDLARIRERSWLDERKKSGEFLASCESLANL